MPEEGVDLVIAFEEERETKGTIRFNEYLSSDMEEPKVGTLYVRKSTLGLLGWERGQRLSVTLQAGDVR